MRERTKYLLVCREDSGLVSKHGLRKVFHVGGMSLCRQHLCSHYALYSKRCQEAGIEENHWAVPRNVWREQEAEKKGLKAKRLLQTKLDGVFKVAGAPIEFTRQNLLEAVAKFVVCDDQVSRKCCYRVVEWL
jgi:hypothetical protein